MQYINIFRPTASVHPEFMKPASGCGRTAVCANSIYHKELLPHGAPVPQGGRHLRNDRVFGRHHRLELPVSQMWAAHSETDMRYTSSASATDAVLFVNQRRKQMYSGALALSFCSPSIHSFSIMFRQRSLTTDVCAPTTCHNMVSENPEHQLYCMYAEYGRS